MLNTDGLPEYTCFKKVWASKIKSIDANGEAAILVCEDMDINISRDYVIKHSPHVGGYFVVYEDGYESFSPAKAFESGYAKT